jgi:cell fate (sporulation/competence/biofilm development) regulator YlbF (YheA/YmcA/DUF963 family)
MEQKMSKIPFERFIITFLLFNKDLAWIINKCKDFGYYITEPEVKELFDDLKSTLPPAVKQQVNDRIMFSIDKPEHAQWLEHFGIAEFYDFLIRKDQRLQDPPPYFKWLRDIVWLHNNHDALAIVNIFMFNGEPHDIISDVISFKFKKKIGVEALDLHRRIFWTTDIISAKEALYHCLSFRSNAMVIRKIRGCAEPTDMLGAESHDGSDVAFVFHDSGYIKWKIGYRGVEIPTAKDFLEKVKVDSYYKYYETMNMTQSVESEEESGNNQFGDFTSKKTRYRNVEEFKAKAAKHWMDLFVKADKAIPREDEKVDNFFDRMDQLELGFDDIDEKIVAIDNAPGILNDIKGDL